MCLPPVQHSCLEIYPVLGRQKINISFQLVERLSGILCCFNEPAAHTHTQKHTPLSAGQTFQIVTVGVKRVGHF